MLDRTAPTAPTVAGGSLSWQSVPSVTVIGGGSTDAGVGPSPATSTTSTNGGVDLELGVGRAPRDDHAEGETLVQFRAVDALGNRRPGRPATAGAANTVRIDRTNPTAAGRQRRIAVLAERGRRSTITGSGATDAGGSGVASLRATARRPTAAPPGRRRPRGRAVTITRRGRDAGAVPRRRPGRQHLGLGAGRRQPGGTVRLDRTAARPTRRSPAARSTWSAAVVRARRPRPARPTPAAPAWPATSTAISVDNGVNWYVAGRGRTRRRSPPRARPSSSSAASTAAGNASAWAPSVPDAGSTVLLDRTGPSTPTVSGGSLAWQTVASVDVAASGSTDAAVRLRRLRVPHLDRRRRQLDAAAHGLVGDDHRRGPDARAVPRDGRARQRVALVARRRHAGRHRPHRPHRAQRAHGHRRLARAGSRSPSVARHRRAARPTRLAGVAGYQYRTSTDGGATWSARAAGRHRRRSPPRARRWCSSAPWTAPATPPAGRPAVPVAGSTVRIDRTAPTAPGRRGRIADLAERRLGDRLGARRHRRRRSGLAGYQYRTSTDGGATWLAPTAGAASRSPPRARRWCSSARWTRRATSRPGRRAAPDGDQHRAHRPHGRRARRPSAGGSLAWQTVASVTVIGVRRRPTRWPGFAGYELRTSTDGGATWSAATAGAPLTMSARGRDAGAVPRVDALGNASAWAPASRGADQHRPHRPHRADRRRRSAADRWPGRTSPRSTIAAGGATDGLSGVAAYQYRTSTDGGATWSAAVTGAAAAITAEGETVVQFRSRRRAPATRRPGRLPPTAPPTRSGSTAPPPAPPTVSGGSLTWQNAASVTVTGSGSTDTPGSGVAAYQLPHLDRRRRDLDGARQTGSQRHHQQRQGQTLVQFRAVDVAGQTLGLGAGGRRRPATPCGSTAPPRPCRRSRGGSLSWQNVAVGDDHRRPARATPLSGVARYEYRTSTDGGTTWSSPAGGSANASRPRARRSSQFRAVDAAGNPSAWAPGIRRRGEHRPHRPHAADHAGRVRRLAGLDERRVGDRAPDRARPTPRQRRRLLPVPDVDRRRRALVVGRQRHHASPSPPPARRSSSSASPTARARARPGRRRSATAGSTVKIDRTRPDGAAVSGGSLTWQNGASLAITASGGSDTGGAGLATAQYRTSTNGGITWSGAQTAASPWSPPRARLWSSSGTLTPPATCRRGHRGARRRQHRAARPHRPDRSGRDRRLAHVRGQAHDQRQRLERRQAAPASTTTSTGSRPTAAPRSEPA